MYNYKFIKGLVFAFSILCLVSCKKSKNFGSDDLNANNNTEVLNSDAELLKLYNFTTEPLDGEFSFQSWSSFAAQSFARNNFLRAGFHTPTTFYNLGTPIKGNLVKVGNVVVPPNSDLYYEIGWETESFIWGNPTEFSFQESTSPSLKKFTFRVPKLLEITYDYNHSGLLNLTLGGNLKVKPDAGNKKGIVIYVEYDPSDNPELSKQGFNKSIRNGEVQNDDGTIEMTSKLLANIPKGAEYQINVARINYEVVEMYGKKYGFYAYLELSNSYKNQ